MKIFSVACFLLLALVPAFAADRPIFSESFEAAGHVAYHGANGPMEGLGRWAVNQVTGMVRTCHFILGDVVMFNIVFLKYLSCSAIFRILFS